LVQKKKKQKNEIFGREKEGGRRRRNARGKRVAGGLSWNDLCERKHRDIERTSIQ